MPTPAGPSPRLSRETASAAGTTSSSRSGVPQPWETGDLEPNWLGYFVPGTSIPRNRVGARTLDALRDAKNDLVEAYDQIDQARAELNAVSE